MKCPASFYFLGTWFRIADVDVGELPIQQTQEPAADQGDIDATGNADLGCISFGDVHEHSPHYAPEKSQSKYFHVIPFDDSLEVVWRSPSQHKVATKRATRKATKK